MRELRDNISITVPIVESFGCVTFFGDLPQIIFGADENRIGFALLVIITKASWQERQLIGAVGRISGRKLSFDARITLEMSTAT